MAFDNNAFCWHGIVSTDLDVAKAFYGHTIGWQAIVHTSDDGSTATIFVANEVPRAHLRTPEHDKEPCRWSSYLRVDDIEGLTSASETNGGKVLVPPTAIAPGTFSVVTSPSGAPLCLHHEADEDAVENSPRGPGSVHWTELHSDNIDVDLPWLTGTFGFEVQEVPFPGGLYYILSDDGVNNCGAVATFHDRIAGTWLNWIEVDNVDKAFGRVRSGGGEGITEPGDYPGAGRMSMVADPTGATFGLIAPASE